MTKERQLHSKTNIGKIANVRENCQFCKSTLSNDLFVVSLALDGLVKWKEQLARSDAISTRWRSSSPQSAHDAFAQNTLVDSESMGTICRENHAIRPARTSRLQMVKRDMKSPRVRINQVALKK